jgi:hypothetical protein
VAQFSVQVPPLQLGEAWFELHTRPHAPQLLKLVFRFVSQPVPGFPSQSPEPGLQAIPHTPLLHAGVPPPELQTLPQLLQLFLSLSRSASQPSDRLLLQSLKCGSHEMPQLPVVHDGVP